MKSLAWVVVSAIVVCGCGGNNQASDGGNRQGDVAACSFTPCGGSLVGKWKWESGCVELSTTTDPSSPCKPFSPIGTPSYSGTAEFTSGGEYSNTMTITSATSGSYSAACLTQTGLTCSFYQSIFSAPDAAMSGTCTSAASGDCDCQVSYHATTSDQGTYTTTGSSFTTTPQGSTDSTTGEFCVQGNTAHVRFTDVSGSSSATFTLVGTRQ